MDNTTLLEIGINGLKSVDTEKIESVDIDRTEHNDGTFTLAVSVTADKNSGKNISINGGNIYWDAEGISSSLVNSAFLGKGIDETVSKTYCSVDSTQHIETNLKFTQNGRYLVIDLGEPTGEKKEVRIEHSIPFYGTYLQG